MKCISLSTVVVLSKSQLPCLTYCCLMSAAVKQLLHCCKSSLPEKEQCILTVGTFRKFHVVKRLIELCIC